MLFDSIPIELKKNALWCAWKLVKDKGKIPFTPSTGKPALSNNPDTFESFQTASSHVHKYFKISEDGQHLGGLGLGIFKGYSAIDIDKCRNPKTGEISEMAQEIIDFCGSYTEISPSKTGIRIIFKTNLSEYDKNEYYTNNRNFGLEIYVSDKTNKFVTITGDVIYPNEIANIDITYILNKYMKKKQTSFVEKSHNLQNVIEKDAKLKELWNSQAPGSGSNESEMDLALINKLAYYLNSDEELINDAFVSSPYFKSKDNSHKNKWLTRNDYRKQTIMKSIESISNITIKGINEFELNDTGNAQRLVTRYGHLLRYNVDNKSWMYYNGQFWQHDTFTQIKLFAEAVVEEMKQQAISNQNPDDVKSLIRNIKRALSSSGKEAMIKEATHISGIPVTNDSFDKDDFLLNTKSGVVNLKNGNILPHEKSNMLSKITNFEVSTKKPKRWIKFLNEIFEENQELIKYVQKMLGYALTGSTKEQVMFILLGDGNNGKSLLLEVFERIIGDYGTTSKIDILLDKKMQSVSPGDVARLKGLRTVVTGESELGDKLKESSIKSLTSGLDRIAARFLYGTEFVFNPKFKIFMASNHKPVIRGTDHGIWRRIKIIPFNKKIEDKDIDIHLIDKLSTELPEILGWCIEGCMMWQKEGLKNTKEMDEALKEYKGEMDIVTKWLEEHCEVHPSYRTKSVDLFKNFTNYVYDNKEYQLSNTMFGRNMSKKFQKKRYQGGIIYYIGVRIRQENNHMPTVDRIIYDKKKGFDEV